MLRYSVIRIGGAVFTLLVMSFIVFSLQTIIPADPVRVLAGPFAPASTVDRVRQQLGLDRPIYEQFGSFLARIGEGDLGTSVRTRQPVADDISRYAPATLELGLTAVALGLCLGVLIVLIQHGYRGVASVRLLLLGLGSIPIFLTALLFVYVFWFRLGWVPGAGRLSISDFSGVTGLHVVDGFLAARPDVSLDALLHLLVPATVLALPIAVAIGRAWGAALQDVMRQSYIRTARGKGLSEAEVVLRHGLRNSAQAPLSMIGLQVGLLPGNLLVVERVFSWPGLGLYTVQAIASADLPAILGIALTFGFAYIVVSALMEVAQSLADPRIEL